MRLNKMGAPMSIDHGKAKAPFETVELARDLHDAGLTVKVIAEKLEQNVNTVYDWIAFKTRTHC